MYEARVQGDVWAGGAEGHGMWMDEQRQKQTHRLVEGPATELVQYSKTIRQMRRASKAS